MLYLPKKVINYIKHNGIKGLGAKVKKYLHDKKAIKDFYNELKLTKEEIEKQKKYVFQYNPKISILIPLYKTPINYFAELINTITEQTYSNWELCLADGTGVKSDVTDYCMDLLSKDSRIKYKLLENNGGISDNTNEALAMAEGEFVMLVDHDDLLEINALFECVKAINGDSEIDSIYTDEDKIDMSGKKRFAPHFKPDFNIEYLRCNNYICHLFVTRRDIAMNIGGFNKKYDGAQDFEFILRCTEQSKKVYHIAKLLYHWRCHENSTAAVPESKLYAYDSGVRAIEDHYSRYNIKAEVSMMDNCFGYYKTKRNISDKATVSVIVLCNNSTDKDIEEKKDALISTKIENIYVVKGNAVEKVNQLIDEIDSEYVILIDEGIEINDNFDIDKLIEYAMDENVSFVTPKIYSADKKLIQGPMILGMNGFYDYSFRETSLNDKGYFFRAVMPQNVTIVDYRCVMMKKKTIDNIGKLSEDMDIMTAIFDLCLRGEEKGLHAVYNPNMQVLYNGNNPFCKSDDYYKSKFIEKWRSRIEQGDSYFNTNLSLTDTDYVIRTMSR